MNNFMIFIDLLIFSSFIKFIFNDIFHWFRALTFHPMHFPCPTPTVFPYVLSTSLSTIVTRPSFCNEDEAKGSGSAGSSCLTTCSWRLRGWSVLEVLGSQVTLRSWKASRLAAAVASRGSSWPLVAQMVHSSVGQAPPVSHRVPKDNPEAWMATLPRRSVACMISLFQFCSHYSIFFCNNFVNIYCKHIWG